eukprot:10060285-Lingulodinium_polyedra.AAC.1
MGRAGPRPNLPVRKAGWTKCLLCARCERTRLKGCVRVRQRPCQGIYTSTVTRRIHNIARRL